MYRLIGALLMVSALSACSSIEPWVKPYERAALADEVMSSDRHPTLSTYGDHIREVREGAHGATGGSGGGCGCN
jgi:hypothetical protein